ncbi:MAG: sensor histidine kinase [Chloroflexota bacterium]|nr:MAG: hypothetical protein DLM70_11480 [Chloroflexota bacterium]
MWNRLTTIRGRLVVWYLGVMALLLLALGVFQSVTLANYLRVTTFDSIRDTARSELVVLGPCIVRSPGDLYGNAERLARLLGSREIGVKIVTPQGATLADHGFGEPGNLQAMQLSTATIRGLIRSAAPAARNVTAGSKTFCANGIPRHRPRHRPHGHPLAPPSATSDNLLLIAVPLGPPGRVDGYAILGRSLLAAHDTVRRAQIVFGLGAVMALLLATLAAIPIINRALRPLHRVAQTAEAIAGGDLDQRAHLERTADEVGRLGSAFDAMVDRLQEALSSARRSEERMRSFLADASHELRTPLTALRGTSQILLRQRVDRADYEKALRAIHLETVRLSKLVDDLLTLTRLHTSQSFHPEPVPVRQFVMEFVERYGPAWRDNVIAVNGPAWGSASAYVEPEALTRILINLVDNAIRFSSAGQPVTMSGRSDSASVSIDVHDDGPGLSSEDAERVFERFYRASKSRSRESGGSGLGLSIVQSLVEANGGRIRIDTALGRGTTVEVAFPRAASNVDDNIESNKEPGESRSQATTTGA